MNRLVIDVSEHQGEINWEQVKTSAAAGAIIRCGFGDDIASQDDRQWKRNANECVRLGIPFGVYIYSYAAGMAQAESEARHVLRCIKGLKLSYPVYLDLEEPGTQAGAVKRAGRFGKIIAEAGYWCGIYANLNWWDSYLTGLDQYTKWVAQYNHQCDYAGSNKDMWQYTSTGKIAGISGDVDMSECYRDFPAEINGPSVSEPKSRPAKMAKQTGEDPQRIYMEDAGEGYVRLKNKKTDLYLDVPGGRAVNDAVLQWYKGNGTDSQLWRLVYKEHGAAQYVLLEPKLAPGKYVSVENNGLDGKKKIKLWDDLKSSKQKFWLKQAQDGSYVFVHTYSLMAITG